ncbi:MAG: pilus assembly protein [Anaerolineales bacterium]
MNTSNREQGQGLVEYALIMILVVIVVIVVLYLLGPAIGNLYSEIIQSI